MTQPNVPWFVAAAVAAAIAVCGFALATNDPNVTFINANTKFLIGVANAALGAFAVYLNVTKKSAA